MSNNPNPFGNPNPYGGQNPYSSPNFAGPPGGVAPLGAKLMVPAIVLLLVAILGILFSTASVVMAFGPPPPVDPNLPALMQELQKDARGPQAAVIQSIFVLVNAFIIFGAVQMLRQKMRVVAIAAAAVAMLNFGSCCCILGAPVGIWSIIILLQEDVKSAFDTSPFG